MYYKTTCLLFVTGLLAAAQDQTAWDVPRGTVPYNSNKVLASRYPANPQANDPKKFMVCFLNDAQPQATESKQFPPDSLKPVSEKPFIPSLPISENKPQLKETFNKPVFNPEDILSYPIKQKQQPYFTANKHLKDKPEDVLAHTSKLFTPSLPEKSYLKDQRPLEKSRSFTTLAPLYPSSSYKYPADRQQDNRAFYAEDARHPARSSTAEDASQSAEGIRNAGVQEAYRSQVPQNLRRPTIPEDKYVSETPKRFEDKEESISKEEKGNLKAYSYYNFHP